MILIIIGVIVYFVVTSGDEEGTDETPSPEEETASMWHDGPGAVLVAAAGALPPQLIIRGRRPAA